MYNHVPKHTIEEQEKLMGESGYYECSDGSIYARTEEIFLYHNPEE